MKPGITTTPLFISLLVCGSLCAQPPQAVISNGTVTATVYLPDAENGYYRGTRFDRSGLIAELEYEGHNYFGEWFLGRNAYDPQTHDAVVGPAEVFDPTGYEAAPVGGEFIVIGVGALRKPQERRYGSFSLYETADPGTWAVLTAPDEVSSTHKLNAAGYSYIYTKTVRLAAGEPELIIEHSLKNTGAKTISTQTYCHNFFTIDGARVGPDVVVEFPFTIEPRQWNDNGLAAAEGGRISFPREFGAKDEVYIGDIRGYGPEPEDFGFSIKNAATGAGVSMTGDRPTARLVFWACASVACPEPFIDIRVAPGEEFTWTNTYKFHVGNR